MPRTSPPLRIDCVERAVAAAAARLKGADLSVAFTCVDPTLAVVALVDEGLLVVPDQQSRVPELSPRMAQVLSLLAEGKGQHVIATTLFLGVHTVRCYTAAVRRYFGVKSNRDAVAKARLWDVIP